MKSGKTNLGGTLRGNSLFVLTLTGGCWYDIAGAEYFIVVVVVVEYL